MNKELDDKLCKDYPILYEDRHGSMRETCMCWGFDVGDGWFDLIDSLSKVISSIVQNQKDSIVYNYRRSKKLFFEYKLTDEENEELGINRIKAIATQVKEKYGGLRFYWRGEGLTEEYYHKIEGAIGMVEVLSYRICELCGCPGRPNGGGWISVRCDSCRGKENAVR